MHGLEHTKLSLQKSRALLCLMESSGPLLTTGPFQNLQMRTHASGRVPDLEMIARDLAMQAEDATSTLRAGTITRFIQALELPTLQPVLHEHVMQQQKQPVYIQQSVLAADDTKFSSGDACHLGQSPKDKVLPAGLDFRPALEIRSSPSAPRLGKGNLGREEGSMRVVSCFWMEVHGVPVPSIHYEGKFHVVVVPTTCPVCVTPEESADVSIGV